MRELRITDGELQRMIGGVLRERLAKAGFRMGTPSDAIPSSFFFPVCLNLDGDVDVVRDADGHWTITQDKPEITERLASTLADHHEAIANRVQKYGA